MTYTIEIIRRIGEHTSSMITEVDVQTAEFLMRADVIRYNRFRIQVDTREYIIEKRKIIFSGDEAPYDQTSS